MPAAGGSRGATCPGRNRLDTAHPVRMATRAGWEASQRVKAPQGAAGERAVPPTLDRRWKWRAPRVVTRSLAPEVEPHFHPDASGYRPGKSALEAIGPARAVQARCLGARATSTASLTPSTPRSCGGW